MTEEKRYLIITDEEIIYIGEGTVGEWKNKILDERKRHSKFSVSNELINCCSKYVPLTKEDFASCPIKKKSKQSEKAEA